MWLSLLGNKYVLGALAVVGVFFYGRHVGVSSAAAQLQSQKLAFQTREHQAQTQLTVKTQQLEGAYRDRQQLVARAQDACLDRPLPSDLLAGLRADRPQ